MELRERTPPAPGHHGSGKLAVWTLWLLILATAGTGWFQNTEMGFELGGGRLACLVYLGPAGHDSAAPAGHPVHLLAPAQQSGEAHVAKTP
ncbi:hypothetical protein H2136_04265 [Aeromonas hydrophila]|uniref:Uncharacterized protein n=1 Tax=Aeromonas hydrophila TaxID=644 RepID=A0A926FL29_AERHY|nr:hypothetical protein [Aeromonas hydrophila]